jgi:hypothetical protein
VLAIDLIELGWRRQDIPTAFSSIICSAFIFAADMFAGVTEVELKKRRRNEMVGNGLRVY